MAAGDNELIVILGDCSIVAISSVGVKLIKTSGFSVCNGDGWGEG